MSPGQPTKYQPKCCTMKTLAQVTYEVFVNKQLEECARWDNMSLEDYKKKYKYKLYVCKN